MAKNFKRSITAHQARLESLNISKKIADEQIGKTSARISESLKTLMLYKRTENRKPEHLIKSLEEWRNRKSFWQKQLYRRLQALECTKWR